MQGTAWKFPLFGMNIKTTNTVFTQWEKTCDVQYITAYQICRYDVYIVMKTWIEIKHNWF